MRKPHDDSDDDDAETTDLKYLRDNAGGRTLEMYILTHHRDDVVLLEKAKRTFKDEEETAAKVHRSVLVCAKTLLNFDQRLGHIVLQRTANVMALFDRAILAAIRGREAALHGEGFGTGEGDRVWNQLVHARLTNLPALLRREKVSDVRCGDVGSFLAVSGTVIRVGTTRVRDRQRTFRCRNKQCGHTFVVEAQIDMGGVIDMPKVCPSSSIVAGSGGGGGNQAGIALGLGGGGGGGARSGAKVCQSKSFEEDEELRVQSDYQELRVQDIVQRLSVGMVPRAITVMLQDDLIEACVPGDDVVLCGLVTRRWGQLTRDSTPDVELVLVANSATASNGVAETITDELVDEFELFWETHRRRKTEMVARNTIIASVCPQIYGLFIVKMAVALAIMGGVGTEERNAKATRARSAAVVAAARRRRRRQRSSDGDDGDDGEEDDDLEMEEIDAMGETEAAVAAEEAADERKQETYKRGSAHLLLIGDPGTGKSQILRFASKLSHRTVLTTGGGTTGAGLTCTAVKDNGEWTLEGGALVLADRGVCCIDEFGAIRKHDRATIHEAMEQQTLSVAKAGLVCTLNTRTTVIASMNPKGRYKPEVDVTINTGIASPLLSRFDMVFVLLDNADKAWDTLVSGFILESAAADYHEAGAAPELIDVRTPAETAASGEASASAAAGAGAGAGAGAEMHHLSPTYPRWRLAKLRAYFCWTKANFNPEISAEAGEVLGKYYEHVRNPGGYPREDRSRTTVRLLNSLIRLAQAHARLMARHEVSVEDAVMAIVMIESSVNETSLIDVESVVRSNFPTDPDAAMAFLQQKVVAKVGAKVAEAASQSGSSGGSARRGSGSRSQLLNRSFSRSEQRRRRPSPGSGGSSTIPNFYNPLSVNRGGRGTGAGIRDDDDDDDDGDDGEEEAKVAEKPRRGAASSAAEAPMAKRMRTIGGGSDGGQRSSAAAPALAYDDDDDDDDDDALAATLDNDDF